MRGSRFACSDDDAVIHDGHVGRERRNALNHHARARVANFHHALRERLQARQQQAYVS